MWSLATITEPAIEPITLEEARQQCELTGTTEHDEKLRRFIRMGRHRFEKFSNRAAHQTVFEQYLYCWPHRDFFELRRGPLIGVSTLAWKDTTGAETSLTLATQYLVDSAADPPRIALPYSVPWPTGPLYPASPIRTRFTAGLGRDIAFTASGSTLTSTAHGLSSGQSVLLRSSGSLPAGLSLDTRYWVRDSAASTFALSASPGGPAIVTSTAGSGTHTLTVGVPEDVLSGMLLLIGQYFSNREASIVGQTATIVSELPQGVLACWANYRAPHYSC